MRPYRRVNFGCGRSLRELDFARAKSACAAAFGGGCGTRFALDFADAKSACAEVQRGSLSAMAPVYG